jgi:hypothetical protein
VFDRLHGIALELDLSIFESGRFRFNLILILTGLAIDIYFLCLLLKLDGGRLHTSELLLLMDVE